MGQDAEAELRSAQLAEDPLDDQGHHRGAEFPAAGAGGDQDAAEAGAGR
ncbi:hypothetical protein [Streptomyces sp. H27-S2]|nr:hypothetical protein [Streptomyces sp. H27-S2]MCY0955227.1 hypothetical protein [Streptomyces sp. H27-S2]